MNGSLSMESVAEVGTEHRLADEGSLEAMLIAVRNCAELR